MKYSAILKALPNNEPHTASSIAHWAKAHDMLPGIDKDSTEREIRQAMTRLRISLNRYHINHEFPSDGDASLLVNGRHYRAWMGWRWSGEL